MSIEFIWDWYNLIPITLGIILSFCLFFLSILFHEVGHILAYKQFTGKEMKLRLVKNNKGYMLMAGEDWQYKNLTRKQYYQVSLVGVLLGLVPLAFVVVWFGFFGFFVLLVFYGIGIRNDLIVLKEYGGKK